MTWGKTADTWHSHPKAVAAGLEAIGLWSLAQSFSSDYRTDGFVPRELAIRFAGPRGPKLAEKLCSARAGRSAGLWHRADDPCEHPDCDRLRRPGEDGWRFHDWAVYQPLRVAIEARETEKSEAKSRAGRLGGVRSGEARREANSKQDGSRIEAGPIQAPKQNEAPIPIPIPGDSHTHSAGDPPVAIAGDPEPILAALRGHKALADVATQAFAEEIAGAGLAGARRLEDVLAGIADAARDAGSQAAAGAPLALAELAKSVGKYVSSAVKSRASSGSRGREKGAYPVQRSPGYQTTEERKRAEHLARADIAVAERDAAAVAAGEEPIPY